MFEPIIQHLDRDIEIDEEDRHTGGFDVQGEIVTRSGLVSLEEPVREPATFRAVWSPAAPPLDVTDLDADQVRRLAVETIRSAPNDLDLGSIGRGSMTLADKAEQELLTGQRDLGSISRELTLQQVSTPIWAACAA